MGREDKLGGLGDGVGGIPVKVIVAVEHFIIVFKELFDGKEPPDLALVERAEAPEFPMWLKQ